MVADIGGSTKVIGAASGSGCIHSMNSTDYAVEGIGNDI